MALDGRAFSNHLAQLNLEIIEFEGMADETLRVHAAFLVAEIAEAGMPATIHPYGLSPANATLHGQPYTTFQALINLPDERAQPKCTTER